MHREQMQIILDKIKEYHRIMLFRHIRNDGDCVGATKTLKEIIQQTWPEKEVYIIDWSVSEYLAFLGPEDESVPDEVYREALGIVLDTAAVKRISNGKYTLCKELIKIDHHVPVESYGDYEWVEEHRSSCCEMIVEFCKAFREELNITPAAATFLYTGMVTDTGRFRFRGVNGDTMRNAGYLLDMGIDTDTLFANLYLENFESFKFKSEIYRRMQITENGVAYLYIDKEMQAEFGLTQERAGAAINELDSIRGCLCWIVFIESGDSIRVRLRSRFAPIITVAEKYNGGGHDCACGATIYSKDEMTALLLDADIHIKNYKETHEGWL